MSEATLLKETKPKPPLLQSHSFLIKARLLGSWDSNIGEKIHNMRIGDRKIINTHLAYDKERKDIRTAY